MVKLIKGLVTLTKTNPQQQSKYAQRMTRLSCKIFGEHRTPYMPEELTRDQIAENRAREQWSSFHYRNWLVVHEHSIQPFDLRTRRNEKYYPPHPQHIKLIDTLREYGLFRDEHLDFKDEMNRLRVARGKVGRMQRVAGKRAQLKEAEKSK